MQIQIFTAELGNAKELKKLEEDVNELIKNGGRDINIQWFQTSGGAGAGGDSISSLQGKTFLTAVVSMSS